MCLPGSGLNPVGPCGTLKQASPWAWLRSRTSHRTSSWTGLQLRDIAAALIPSWIETHEGSRTIDARGEAGPYGPYDVPFPPLFVSSLTGNGSGRAIAEGVHVPQTTPRLEKSSSGEVSVKAEKHSDKYNSSRPDTLPVLYLALASLQCASPYLLYLVCAGAPNETTM